MGEAFSITEMGGILLISTGLALLSLLRPDRARRLVQTASLRAQVGGTWTDAPLTGGSSLWPGQIANSRGCGMTRWQQAHQPVRPPLWRLLLVSAAECAVFLAFLAAGVALVYLLVPGP